MCDTNYYRYRMKYECPKCKTKWHDEYDCACNDECPNGCMKDIEPVKVMDLCVHCGAENTIKDDVCTACGETDPPIEDE